MGRALTFSDPRIIQLLKERFVPVATDINTLHRQDDEEGRFLRLVAWQGRSGLSFEEAKVRMLHPERRDHQGLYAVTTEGELLSARLTKDPNQLLEVLEKALENWERRTTQLTASHIGEVQDRDARYVSAYPEEGLVLHLGCMDLPREVDLRPEDWPRETHNQDYAWITRGEMLAIVPDDAKVGDVFPMHGPVARRLIRFHFLDSVRGETDPWPMEAVRSSEMMLIVTGVTPDRVDLRLSGHVRLFEQGAWCGRNRNDGICCLIPERGYDAQMLGYLTFDRRGFSRFDLAVVGTRWGGTTYNVRYNDVEPAPMGIAFTMAGREARDRTPPHAGSLRYFET
ncbi:MAG: hypothetical protein EXS64_15505 [Candidatus Latescibacteria bacterium]|nr:hypothetical protein [Candidatus Latescibacterota bacterium]